MMLLRDASIEPTAEVLSTLLGEIYPVYDYYLSVLSNKPLDLEANWKYYRDGNAWLCKIADKKKTIAWISIWEDCLKVTVYFSAKYISEIDKLPVKENLLAGFHKTAESRKNPFFSLEIREKEQLDDLLTIMSFKKKCK